MSVAADFDLVLATIFGLLAMAVATLTLRMRGRFIGVFAGSFTLVMGVATLFLHPEVIAKSPLYLDAASLPRMAVAGIMLFCVFMVLPRRQETVRTSAALVGLTAIHIALAAAPDGELAAALWVLGAVMTSLVLPRGPARRLAIPYLAFSAITGVVGLSISGPWRSVLILLSVVSRLGIFPFHTWVVGAYSLAPLGVSVALVAPMAAISLVAHNPLELDDQFGLVVAMVLAGGSLLYAALAIVQKNFTRGLGFLTVSVETSVLLGVLEGDDIGHLGGLIMWGMTGLALLGLGLVSAGLVSRRGEFRIDDYSGLLDRAPVFATLFLLFGLAAVGAPGTADYVSEDLVLHGGMAHHPPLLMLFIASVSTQGYAVLHIFYRLFFGPPKPFFFRDALRRERFALVGLALMLVFSGLLPQLLLNSWLRAGDKPGVPHLERHRGGETKALRAGDAGDDHAFVTTDSEPG